MRISHPYWWQAFSRRRCSHWSGPETPGKREVQVALVKFAPSEVADILMTTHSAPLGLPNSQHQPSGRPDVGRRLAARAISPSELKDQIESHGGIPVRTSM